MMTPASIVDPPDDDEDDDIPDTIPSQAWSALERKGKARARAQAVAPTAPPPASTTKPIANRAKAPNAAKVTVLLHPQQLQQLKKKAGIAATAPVVTAAVAAAAPDATPQTRKSSEQPSLAFDVEVADSLPGTTVRQQQQLGRHHTRYRDAMSLGKDRALLLMTDFLNDSQYPEDAVILSKELLQRWQKSIRNVAGWGASPDSILQLMNHEVRLAGLEATATCAIVHVHERRLNIATAGAAAPWIIRSNECAVRARATNSVALGRVPSVHFQEQTLPFDCDDTLLVPSTGWTTPLERLFEAPIELALQSLRFALREQRAQPAGASILRLTLRH